MGRVWVGQIKSSKLSPIGETEGATYNMKKNYVSPLMVEVNVEAEAMLAASLQISDKSVDTSAEGAQLGKENDRQWGNLWN